MESFGELTYCFDASSDKDVLVLVPGWATDSRIFHHVEWPDKSLLMIDMYDPFTLAEDLQGLLKELSISKVSLVGFSMGTFAALEFVKLCPGLVDKLVLVALRPEYPKKMMFHIQQLMKELFKGYLNYFYEACFRSRSAFEVFEKELFDDYVQKFSYDYLVKGLSYLQERKFRMSDLDGVEQVQIIHGTRDEIAPIGEVRGVVSQMENVSFVKLRDVGHIPFFESTPFSTFL